MISARASVRIATALCFAGQHLQGLGWRLTGPLESAGLAIERVGLRIDNLGSDLALRTYHQELIAPAPLSGGRPA
jgi:hypothetical protein